jgi:hypothetical protein
MGGGTDVIASRRSARQRRCCILGRSGVSVGRRPHRFVDNGLLLRIGAARLGQALPGEYEA